MVPSTSFSGSAGSRWFCEFVRASRSQKMRGLVWECRPGTSPTGRAGRPDDNWSRVRGQRLQGQTGRSVLVCRRTRWSGSGTASRTPLRRYRGDPVVVLRLVVLVVVVLEVVVLVLVLVFVVVLVVELVVF